MIQSSTLRTVFFYVLAGAFVSIVPLLVIQQYRYKINEPPADEIPLPTSLPRQVDLTTDTVVYKTTEAVTVTYWLYGKVVSWGAESPDSVTATFVFEKDPLKTRIPIKIMGEENRFYLRMYAPRFGNDFKLKFASHEELKSTVLTASPTVELRVVFLRKGVNAFDQQLMNNLESVNVGKWQDLSARELQVESIGIEVERLP